nr:hypothetical protein [Tanacetum cinerariifolium]
AGGAAQHDHALAAQARQWGAWAGKLVCNRLIFGGLHH